MCFEFCGSLELPENTEGEGRRKRHPDVRGRSFSSLKGSWPASSLKGCVLPAEIW